MAKKDNVNYDRMTLNISRAVHLLKEVIAHNIECATSGRKGFNDFVVPYFVGDPGVGKTAIPQIAAKDLELDYYQSIVAQYDAGVLAGLPFASKDEDGNDTMVTLRPDHMPPLRDANGNDLFAIWNLDELPQAFLAQQNIISQLVNQWKIGRHQVSRGVTMVATGNKTENRAGTTQMPTHLKDRLARFVIEPDADEWIEFAASNNVHYAIRSYIKEFPGHLHKFDATAESCPTPRSWEKLSAFLKMNLKGHTRTMALIAQIGPEAGTNFETYLRIEDKMPKREDVIKNPESAPTFDDPKDASILYMLLANLADCAKADNIGQMLKYAKRLKHADIFAWFLKDVILSHPELNKHKDIVQIKITHGARLIGE